MISEFAIERFKCFENEIFNISNLTMLAGGNATGKSTFIQALLLLRQSNLNDYLESGELHLNGGLVNIGTAKDAFASSAEKRTIKFSLKYTNPKSEINWQFEYDPEKSYHYVLNGNSITIPDINLFKSNFNYLSAERLGPRLYQPIPDQNKEKYSVGVQGEYTLYCLENYGQEDIRNLKLLHPEQKESTNLINQTKYWMQPIIKNFDIQTSAIEKADIVHGEMKNHGVTTDYLRATNIGFGVSYSLPIIVSALLSEKNSILIVENPEAHLHPAAQSHLGRFLAKAASAGIQIIVETHSDHILNGIRLSVKENLIDSDNLSLLYFSSKKNKHTVQSLDIDKNGKISKWPKGFFDQAEQDLMELL
jgi:predicted ATPase